MEHQFGFRRGDRATGHLFALRLLMERPINSILIGVIDFMGAYNAEDTNYLDEILMEFETPMKFVNLLKMSITDSKLILCQKI
jgi:hypothetical protein